MCQPNERSATMDANICAASRALMDWDMAYRETHDETTSSSLQYSHLHLQSEQLHSPSSSPSFSSESESYPLSRCSSVSSLSSAYSDSDTSDTEDCSDNAHFLISILKKPRLLRGSKQQHQQGCESQMSNQHNYNNSHSGSKGDSDAGNANRLKEYVTENEEDDEWQDLDDDEDDESQCEIIFERNVTFDDPLATDIITGAPVPPSSRSRDEWTALKARERLERRLGFLGVFEEEEGDDISQDMAEERHEDLGGESESKRGAGTRGTTDDDGNIEAYVLTINGAAVQFVELERIQ
ncbi:hypothetical protein F4680DRAFT_421555 [Xylaria scruposa]|nr:hypothetical protein F4680DRAFT_421555 [Xylaria scruposa]